MLLAGLGVALVALLIVLDWNGLLAGIHLRRLRASPAYLLSIVERPEGTPERLAIREWLEDRRGREAFFEVYSAKLLSGFAGVVKQFQGGQGLIGLEKDEVWYSYLNEDRSGGFSIPLAAWQVGHPLQRLLYSFKVFDRSLLGQTFRLEKYPGVAFRFVTGSEALNGTGLSTPGGKPLRRDDSYCLVLPDPPADPIQPPPRSTSPR